MKKTYKNIFVRKPGSVFSILSISFLILILNLKDIKGHSDETTFVLACSKNIFSNVNLNDASAAMGSRITEAIENGSKFRSSNF